MIAIVNMQVRADTVKEIKSAHFSNEPDRYDCVTFFDKIGNQVQLDASLLHLGLLGLAKSRNMTLDEYIKKAFNILDKVEE